MHERVAERQQVEGDEGGRRRLGQLADALLRRMDALGQRVEVEAAGTGDDDLAVEHAARPGARAAARRPARGSSGSAVSRCGCPAPRRRRRGRRCSGSRPTSARRRARRRAGARGRAWRAWAPPAADGQRHAVVSPHGSPLQASSSSTEPRLTIRSGGTPASTALAQPRPSQASWPGAWASVSIANEHPSVDGVAQQLLGRVLALGPRVDLHRGPGAGAGGEHRLGVEGGLRPATPGDEAPGAVAEDVGVRALDGRQHALGHAGATPCAAWSGRWPPRRRARPAAPGPGRASRPRGCPPRCRSGCGTGPDRRSASATTSSWSRSRSASSPWATVRRALWSVSTRYSWPRSRAASAISLIGLPPSDQSECAWQSPRSESSSACAASSSTMSSGGPPAWTDRPGTSPRAPR